MTNVDGDKRVFEAGGQHMGKCKVGKQCDNLALLPLLFVWLGVCNKTFPVTLFR